jgi:2-oxoglutarate dehydrogenase E2 component (dihydrolipoamide succinyltransferase)
MPVAAPAAKRQSRPATAQRGTSSNLRFRNTISSSKKILDEKNIAPASITGTGKDGRITKEDAVNAVPSMGTPTGGSVGERTKLSMLRRKVAESLVVKTKQLC